MFNIQHYFFHKELNGATFVFIMALIYKTPKKLLAFPFLTLCINLMIKKLK